MTEPVEDTYAYRLGRALALLRGLVDPEPDVDRAGRARRRKLAREFLEQEEARDRAAEAQYRAYLREREDRSAERP